MNKLNQKGFAPLLLILLAALGIIIYVLVSSTFPFKDKLFSFLYPKPSSHASELTRDLTNQLITTSKEYKLAKQDQKAEVLSKLKSIALKRKEQMINAAKSDPDTFVLNAIPSKIKDKLPKEVAEFVEHKVTAEGKLTVTIFDNFEKNTSYTKYKLDKYNLIFRKGTVKAMQSGDHVKVEGFVLDNNLVIDLAGGTRTFLLTPKPQVLAATSPPSKGRTTGGTAHKVAIQLINFTDDTSTNAANSQPITIDNVKENFFALSPNLSVDSYYRQNSYDKMYFTGTVFDWKTLPTSNAPCKDIDFRHWADLADKANNIKLRDYDHFVYIFPQSASCLENGKAWADVGGKRSWYSGSNSLYVFSHEIGHNLGLGHADVLRCLNSATQDNCTVLRGKDIYTTMGSNQSEPPPPHFNTPEKVALGWITATNIRKSGIYDIYPLEINSSFPLALKIITKNEESYFLEYRQTINLDNIPFMSLITEGVSIHLWDGSVSSNTQLLELPELKKIDSQFNIFNLPAVSLTDGESFVDQVNAPYLKVKQISHNSTKAQVEISFGSGQCANHSPSISVFTNDNATYPGDSVVYDVTVVNNDSDACPPSTFDLFSELQDGFSGTFSPASLTIPAAESATSTWTVTTPSSALDALYKVLAIARNSATTSLEGTFETVVSVYSPPPPEPTPEPTSPPKFDPSTGVDGTLDLSLGGSSGGCSGSGLTWTSGTSTCSISVGGVNNKSVFNFTSINIPQGVTLTTTGTPTYSTSNPAEFVTLKALNSVDIAGTINLNGKGYIGATNGNGWTSQGPGGGGMFGGGGYGGKGGGVGGNGGLAYTTEDFGSGGGYGDFGQNGGNGGGGIKIQSVGDSAISGTIQADGNGGACCFGPAGGPGGSGGMLFFQSESNITVSGTLSAKGGILRGTMGSGGGGGGRITLESGGVLDTTEAIINLKGGRDFWGGGGNWGEDGVLSYL